MSEQPLIHVDQLAVSFPVIDRTQRQSRRVNAVNGVSMTIYPQQTLAVVGESGCGKSVSALSTLQLVPVPPGRYESGNIWWRGAIGNKQAAVDGKPVDLLSFSEKQMREIRGNEIAMIFQEPMTSLNPVYTIGSQILEAILLHQKVSKSEAISIAVKALDDVGIADPASRLKEYPHQLSGGMRQRVMIAMALACQPTLLLADEPTTALDVTIQAQILELLRHIQREHRMSIMLITHDLGVVAENADTVAVMYAGRIVEYGSVHDVFDNPLHPYTVGLFKSMPVLGRSRDRLVVIEGQVPNLSGKTKEYAVDREGNPTDKLVVADPTVADVIMRDGRPVRVFRGSFDEQPELREVQPSHWCASFAAEGYDQAQTTPPDTNYRRDSATVAST